MADAARPGDEQLDPVAGYAVCLRRFGGVGGGGAIVVGVRDREGHGRARAGHSQVAGPVAAGRRPGVEQSQKRRHDRLRVCAVGDVLARECGLMHFGAHVAWIEGVDPDSVVLNSKNRGELIEGGLS